MPSSATPAYRSASPTSCSICDHRTSGLEMSAFDPLRTLAAWRRARLGVRGKCITALRKAGEQGRLLTSRCRPAPELAPLARELIGQRLIDRSAAIRVRRAEQADLGMPAIVPPGKARHRVNTYALHFDPATLGLAHFVADIMKPCRPRGSFRASFGNEDRLAEALVSLDQLFCKPTVIVMAQRNGRAAIDPLIVRVEVEAKRIGRPRAAAKVRGRPAEQDVVGLELPQPQVFRAGPAVRIG